MRVATAGDARAFATIYRPYVVGTAVSFEIEAPSPAGMAEPSVGLHRALEFRPIGTYHRVGFKHGDWHDVAWVERPLGPVDDPPSEPR